MSKKVWVIEDTPEKEVSKTKTGQRIIPQCPQQKTIQRNPYLAYSLSLVIWGCGQFYNRQWRLGILFLLFMIYFYLSMSIAIIYWVPIKSFFESIYIDCSGTLLIFGFFYLSGLIVWHLNAWQAYFKNIDTNAKLFNGIKMTVLPSVCSLLMPGWGQVLNGQTKKGLFFQLFSLTGLATFPSILIILFVWPTLEASRSRLFIEWILSVSIIFSPVIIMMWICNIFDAVKISTDNIKKEPLLKRIKYAISRFRYQLKIYGWKNTLLPLVKRHILVILLLTFCVVTYQYVPKQFYMQQLQHLGNRMSEKEMSVIPGIIKNLSGSISSGN